MDEPRSDDTPAEDAPDLGRRWRDYLGGAESERARSRPAASDDDPEPVRGRADTSRAEALRATVRDRTPRALDVPDRGPSRYRWVPVVALIVAAPITLFVLAQQGGGPDGADAMSGPGGAASELPAAGTDSSAEDVSSVPAHAASGAAVGPSATGSDGAIATRGASVSRTDTARTDTAPTPELLDLVVGATPELTTAPSDGGATPARILSLPVGGEGVLRVSVRRASGAASDVPIVLRGSEALPDVDTRLEAVTDSAGSATFRLPAGGRPDTVALEILARGFWLGGANRIVLRVVP